MAACRMKRCWKVLQHLSRWAFLALVALVIVGAVTREVFPISEENLTGCYWSTSSTHMIECHGVPLAGFVSFILSLPAIVFVYSWVYLYMSMIDGVLLPWPIYIICITGTGLLVLGAIYPVIWLCSKSRRRRAGPARERTGRAPVGVIVQSPGSPGEH